MATSTWCVVLVAFTSRHIMHATCPVPVLQALQSFASNAFPHQPQEKALQFSPQESLSSHLAVMWNGIKRTSAKVEGPLEKVLVQMNAAISNYASMFLNNSHVLPHDAKVLLTWQVSA